MEKKINKQLLSNYAYEIIERIVRFIMHLEEIEIQFYGDSEDKKSLIKNYKDTLYRLLSVVLIGYKHDVKQESNVNIDDYFKLLKDVLKLINKLHKDFLPILPRPSEPVELTRFERVIHKQIVKLTNEAIKKDISISLNEDIGENIKGDYLFDYKEEMSKMLNNYQKFDLIPPDYFLEKNKKQKLNITVPRIDASNTFRWPSLIHEMCHSLLPEVNFENNKNIENEFLEFVDGKRESIFDCYFNDIVEPGKKSKLSNWLEECWCDLFSCILIGPSLYFSQYMAFINDEDIVSITHPPHAFRLDLIETIIKHRFPRLHEELLEEKSISECEKLIAFLQDDPKRSFRAKSELTVIFDSFNRFFTSHFLSPIKEDGVAQLKNNPEINEKLKTLVNKYVRIHPEVIIYLVDRLKTGLPIPSIKVSNDKNEYEELPTYVQEIFLASWLSRFEKLMPDVLDKINEFSDVNIIGKIEESYNEIKKIVFRHDQAILKSIQVSEWFDFLINEKRRPTEINIFTNKAIDQNIISNIKGILVDNEIESLILQNELNIIPIMYINKEYEGRELKQIGTTSIDVRLGTSFQVFYPDQYGIIDFTQEDNNKSHRTSSKRINLDFLEGITITPGQFLLGHSMEYMKLPDSICGNLEGRSSFARLGIEIHMTAGYIDPGFEGVLTFEIYNAGPTTVKLYPGMRIGQIRFERNNNPKETYSNKHSVKYKGLLEHDISRQSKDFEVELIKNYNKEHNK